MAISRILFRIGDDQRDMTGVDRQLATIFEIDRYPMTDRGLHLADASIRFLRVPDKDAGRQIRHAVLHVVRRFDRRPLDIVNASGAW